MTNTQLQMQLQELIANSAALNSLPQEARDIRTNAMLSADDSTMQQFIDVLSNEAMQLEKINQDMASQTEEIGVLVAEAKQLEKQAERAISKEAESSERAGEEAQADALLKQLDEIAGK